MFMEINTLESVSQNGSSLVKLSEWNIRLHFEYEENERYG